MSRRFPLALLAALVLSCCGESPEQQLLGRWSEVDWRYEKLDRPAHQPGDVRWLDNIAFPVPREERLVRHESEWWEFQEGGVLVIHMSRGGTERARWRLKGRGHVVRLQPEGSPQYELYDIEELNDRELVLYYDVGVEVRGIARLRFERIDPDSPFDGMVL